MEGVKKEKRLSTNKFILPILFIACSIILEIANFLFLGFKSASGARMVFPTYFLFDISIIFMIAALMYLFQNKYVILTFFCIAISVQAIMGVVNSTLYKLFGEVLSITMFKLGAEAHTAFSFDLIDWGGFALNIGLLVPMIISGILLVKFNKSIYVIKNFAPPIIAIAVFILIESISTCLYQFQLTNLAQAEVYESEVERSDVYLWENFQFKIDAYKKFGFYGFYSKDIINTISRKSLTEDEQVEYQMFIDEGHVDGNKEAPLHGDNLIVILLESLDSFGIDPIYTPTLWEMWQGQNTIVLNNFRARNRTNNSEGITLLGSMPRDSSIKNAYDSGYKFNYSLPKLFKQGGEENVVTTYVHANTATFYDRNITHGKDGIGFDRLITQENYTGNMGFKKFGYWSLEQDFVENVIDYMLPTEQRFLTYFTTLSTHGPYTIYKEHFADFYNEYDNKKNDYITWLNSNGYYYPKEEKTQNMLRNFKVATIDLDNTIKYLLEEIEKRGLADNTSILMFADHNAYYHDLCYTLRDVEKSDFSNTEVNHIPAMIYSPKLAGKEGKKVEYFCNTYDLLPTICDLYGLASNSNIFLGHSVFSEDIENSFFASHLGGMFTDNIFSQNITDIYIRGENVTEDEIMKFKENAIIFYEKQEKLEKIYLNGVNGKKI